jgi:hypothetical protein
MPMAIRMVTVFSNRVITLQIMADTGMTRIRREVEVIMTNTMVTDTEGIRIENFVQRHGQRTRPNGNFQ